MGGSGCHRCPTALGEGLGAKSRCWYPPRSRHKKGKRTPGRCIQSRPWEHGGSHCQAATHTPVTTPATPVRWNQACSGPWICLAGVIVAGRVRGTELYHCRCLRAGRAPLRYRGRFRSLRLCCAGPAVAASGPSSYKLYKPTLDFTSDIRRRYHEQSLAIKRAPLPCPPSQATSWA